MCISDYRIGRLITENVQAWNNGTGTGITLQPNRQRVGLLISSSIIMNAATGYLITFSGGATIAVYGAMPHPFITLTQHGRLVQEGATITVLFGNVTGSFTEMILPESVLADEISRYESELARLGRPGY